jgi:DNA-binding MarR family transcriptional regulator
MSEQDMERQDAVRWIERALVQLARGLGRRHLGRNTERKLGKLVDPSHLAVVDAVEECTASEALATVGHIGRKIGVDPSRASRMVAAAIRAGYVARMASQEDGRKTCLMLTAKGADLAQAVRAMRVRLFHSRLQTWPDDECRELARLLTRLAGDMAQRRKGDHADADTDGDHEGAVIVLHPSSAKPQAPRTGQKRRRTTR